MLTNDFIEKKSVEQDDADVSTDLFATDFFLQDTVDSKNAFETKQNAQLAFTQEVVADWFEDLPKISIEEAELSNLMLEIPDGFSKNIIEICENSLSQCVLNDSGKAVCEFITSEEVDFESQLETYKNARSVFFQFAVEPKQNSGLLILDAVFASTIIKIAFGDENAVVERRAFSNIELAVLDFFALCCLGEINKSLSEPLFKLRNVAQNSDALEFDAKSSQNSRVFLYKFRLQLKDSIGIAELLLPFDLLKNLGESDNVLVKHKNRNNDESRLAKIVSGFRLHVKLGETALDSSDLAFLEVGDVIIIERPNVTLNEANIEGNAQIRISDEANGSLFGELNTTERGLSFAVSEISQNSKFSQPQRFRMQETFNENQLEDSDANASVALEKLTLTVNAEIASRRMTLHEIAQIRVGQVIELGSQVTDPIELVADGKTIAIGSLVNIEGNLGVRLTRVLV